MSKSIFIVVMLFCATVFFSSCDTQLDADSDSGDSVLTLYANYGENEWVEQRFNSRAVFKIKENPFVRDGYTFLGWADDASALTVLYGNLSEVAFSEDTALYALWQLNTYKISYQMAYGKRLVSHSEEFTVETGALLNPVKEDTKYHFAGWYEDEQFTGEPVTEIEKGETGNRTFYARWCGVAVYHLNNGVFGEEEPDLFSENAGYYTVYAPYTLPVPTRAGYAFEGWYKTADCTGDGITALESVTDSVLALYAGWKEAEYTVTYAAGDAEEGDVPDELSDAVKYGERIIVAENDGNLSAEGKTFVGWYYKADEEVSTVLPGDSLTVTGDVRFFPAWRLDTYLVAADSTDDAADKKKVSPKAIEHIEIAPSVSELGTAVFADFVAVDDVDLASVAVIGDAAFKNCRSLAAIDLSLVTQVGDGAFADCKNLLSVVLPDVPPSFGSAVFARCPDNITFIVSEESLETYKALLTDSVVGKKEETYRIQVLDRGEN